MPKLFISFLVLSILLFCLYSVPESGETPRELEVYDFKGPGIALSMYNVDEVGFFICFFKLVHSSFVSHW